MVAEQHAAPIGATRRERQRARVLDEIVEAGHSELREHGVAAVSMRAVARSIDIAPSGLYRYVPDHEGLLTLLAKSSLDDLASAVSAAQQAVDASDHAGRWYVGCLALRDWALGHPAEYGLVFDSASPGGRAVSAAENPVIQVFAAECAEALAADDIDRDRAAQLLTSDHPDVEAAELLAATGLACVIGQVSLEISTHWPEPMSVGERFPLLVRAVMGCLGFGEPSPSLPALRVTR